MLPITITEN